MDQTLFVSGASGNLGRAVLQHLAGHSTAKIIAGTRSPEKAIESSVAGVEFRKADFDEPTLLDRAFAGVDRLLIISTDTLDVPGKRLRQHTNAVEAALRAGVRHIVYTSLTNSTDTPVLIAPDHAATEKLIQEKAPGYTILRNNIYAEMLLLSLPRAVACGQLIAAAGDGQVGYVTRDDCAAAAAAALGSDFSGKRVLDITGPSMLSNSEIAMIVARITAKKIECTHIPVEKLQEGLLAAGLPEALAAAYASFDVAIAAGKMAVVTGAMQELTGVAPTQLADFLSNHREVLLTAPDH